MQQSDYSTKTMSYEIKIKCLRVMQGGFNMNRKCNQKLMLQHKIKIMINFLTFIVNF